MTFAGLGKLAVSYMWPNTQKAVAGLQGWIQNATPVLTSRGEFVDEGLRKTTGKAIEECTELGKTCLKVAFVATLATWFVPLFFVSAVALSSLTIGVLSSDVTLILSFFKDPDNFQKRPANEDSSARLRSALSGTFLLLPLGYMGISFGTAKTPAALQKA